MAGDVDVCFYGTTSNTAISDNPPVTIDDRRQQGMGARRSVAERPRRLDDAAVLTLDGYGTLVDRESGVIGALMPWLHDVGVTAGRGEILRAFAQAERTSLIAGISYRDVLISVHDRLADFFGVAPDRKAAEDFASSITRWPVHPDVPPALAYLKQHFQLVVVTNADHASFDTTNEALGVEFDAVYTAEDSGAFKPSVDVFGYLLNRFEEAKIEKRQVLHVAGSIRFDHVPAKRLAMNTCWIHRRNGAERLARARRRGLNIHPDFRFQTLSGLAEAHRNEVGKASKATSAAA